jgi:hypothetical protein
MQTWEQSFGKIFNNSNLRDDDCLLLKSKLVEYPRSQLEDIPFIMQAEVGLALKKMKICKNGGHTIIFLDN